jgi:hypothetical protein
MLLPVIGQRSLVLVLFGTACALAYLVISYLFWFRLCYTLAVWDAGLPSMLGQVVPMVVGALAYDALLHYRGSTSGRSRKALSFPTANPPRKLLLLCAAGAGLMLEAYVLSCLPLGPVCFNDQRDEVACPAPELHWALAPFAVPSSPTVVSLLSLAKKNGSTISYQLFASGFSLVMFILCLIAGDWLHWEVPFLTLLGSEALTAYVVHEIARPLFWYFDPSDAPWWWSLPMSVIFCSFTWMCVKWMKGKGTTLRL